MMAYSTCVGGESGHTRFPLSENGTAKKERTLPPVKAPLSISAKEMDLMPLA